MILHPLRWTLESHPTLGSMSEDSLNTTTAEESPPTPDSLGSVAPDSLDPPSPDQDPSDSSTDSDSSAEDDNRLRQIGIRLHELRRTILSRHTLNPPVYRPPRAGAQTNIRPRILQRRRYAAVQRAWKKDRGRIVRDILNGKDPLSVATPPPGTREYWSNLFGRPSPDFDFPTQFGQASILDPLSLEEIAWLKKTVTPGSASGPDGLSSKDFKQISDADLQELYNLKLTWGQSTIDWQEARTVLIPKTDNPESPAEFRPITISSVLTRGLHKILARRLTAIAPIDQLQRGFKAEDGVAGNLLTLKTILKAAKTGPSSAYIAFIDFRKAFDSVYHGAVLESAAQAGLDEGSVRYLASVYSSLRTRVMGEETTIRRGVAQGDPLSPALFNLTLQRALRAIPEEVGLRTTEGNTIRWMAFADDIVVMASSPTGLRISVNCLLEKAATLGLEPGIPKCAVMGIRAANGTWYADSPTITFQDQELPRLGPGDFYKYLGVELGLGGPDQGRNLRTMLHRLTERLRTAPMKPQQKFWAFKISLLPRLLHQALFAEPTLTTLKTLDRLSRKFTRKMLHLPKDTPLGAFHASTSEGGLGIFSFVTGVPALRKKRLARLAEAPDAIVSHAARSEPRPTSVPPKYWANKLHDSVDGAGLREAHLLPSSSKWLTSGTQLMRGASYIQALKTRLSVLSTPARSARGRDLHGRCDLGCQAQGTMHHIMQVCPRVQPWRIQRHNGVLDLVSGWLRDENFNIRKEPRITTPQGLRIPDLICHKDGKAYVLDVQVCSDSNSGTLTGAHQRKVDKYHRPSILEYVKDWSGTAELPTVSSITINWRGIVATATLLS